MKKIYLKLIAGLMCFKNVQPISHYRWAIFSPSRMKALLVLKDLQPNRPDKATYLANHKKTGLWPWTQLSASPRPQPSFFVIYQVSRFVRPIGLQIFQDEESFHSAGRENGPSVMRNGLYIFKTHQTGNQFQISFFISRF